MNQSLTGTKEKACPTCKVVKPFSSFGTYKTGLIRKHCRVCANRPDRNKKYSQREKEVLTFYGKKKCYPCGMTKNISDFGKDKRASDGLNVVCRDCHNKRNTRTRESNREKYKRINRESYERNLPKIRERQYQKKFGISVNDYNAMFAAQGGRCLCCNIHQDDINLGFAVDHCHQTGIVRGLLCGSCNTALGLVKDSTDTLKKMLYYLENSQLLQRKTSQ